MLTCMLTCICLMMLTIICLQMKILWKKKDESTVPYQEKIGDEGHHPLHTRSPYKRPVNFISLASTEASTSLSHDKHVLSNWKSFKNVWLDSYYQMAYTSPDDHASADGAKRACLLLGCAAVTVETNGWLVFFRNVPTDRSKWIFKADSTMWVVGEYLDGSVEQPAMHYGCSRHEHACQKNPEEGSAPCCANVMLEIMLDLSRVLRKHGIHWRLAQGQQLSIVRDGIIQQFDHDFDPVFESGMLSKAKSIIDKEMHLAGKASKYREADYHYTKKLASQLKTNWSKYSVMGFDFGWNERRFHNPYTLQRNPTFMDVGQSHDAPPTKDNTFPCLVGADVLCSRNWFSEVTSAFRSSYRNPPLHHPKEQLVYSGYVRLRKTKDSIMFEDNGVERDSTRRDEAISTYISKCPDFWVRPCTVYTVNPILVNMTKKS